MFLRCPIGTTCIFLLSPWGRKEIEGFPTHTCMHNNWRNWELLCDRRPKWVSIASIWGKFPSELLLSNEHQHYTWTVPTSLSSTLSCEFRHLTVISDDLRVIFNVLGKLSQEKNIMEEIKSITCAHAEWSSPSWVCIPHKSLVISGIQTLVNSCSARAPMIRVPTGLSFLEKSLLLNMGPQVLEKYLVSIVFAKGPYFCRLVNIWLSDIIGSVL